MIPRHNDKSSQLFTLRVWPEELSEGRVEWRGKIQRVVDGETLYFHDWEAMMSFLLKTLSTNVTGMALQSEHHEEGIK